MSESFECAKICPKCKNTFTAKMSKLLGCFSVPIRTFKLTPELCPPCADESKSKEVATSLRRHLNFSRERVKSYFVENAPVQGDTLILCMQQFYQSRYRLVIVQNPDHGRQHRIIIDNGCSYAGASFYRTGQSTFAPKSQTLLLPFVPAVGERLSYEQDTVLTDEDLFLLLESSD